MKGLTIGNADVENGAFPFPDLVLDLQRLLAFKYFSPLSKYSFSLTSKSNMNFMTDEINYRNHEGKGTSFFEKMSEELGFFGREDLLDFFLDAHLISEGTCQY